MKRTNFIALDEHSTFCEGGYIDDAGREKSTWREPTSISELVKAIEAIPRPRKLVIEEGPLADWLYRNLSPKVDEMIVCDPHRNALIAKDGDKSDALDWRKLAAFVSRWICQSSSSSALAGTEPVQATRSAVPRSREPSGG